jgi:phosphoglycolate phosphatase-like HAD superfamily hydrolase
MQIIEGVLFEPVGCLAEFPPEPFHEIAARLFGRRKKPSTSGSRSYWHLLNLMQAAGRTLDASEKKMVEGLEAQAVAAAGAYEDVLPALSELKAMGVPLFIASSLSDTAITRFLERYSLPEFFSAVWSRDNAGGVKAAPLAGGIGGASLHPERVMFITDTSEGLKVAKSVGVQSILMMNDPEEARRLAMRNPTGGIVSLHELPDFIRLVAAENARLPS